MMELLKSYDETQLIHALAKAWNTDFENIVAWWNEGSVFVFTKESIYDFYHEAGFTNADKALEADINDQTVVKIRELFFMI
ncbi:MAG: hypothetical protein CMO80_21880 [Verrucomicrobiales bacterium]|nr:hypothetical protein [Verrucomicrobiales bacterium]|tara:strand:+ start:1733 stop:1975 length:243 start_codon:yes stop_codon:yes gene_type:complete